MLRRLATWWILLVSLAGVVPAAVACVALMQGADCCPGRQPCDTGRIPAVTASDVRCCLVRSTAVQSVAAISAPVEPRFADSSAPDHSFVPASTPPASPLPSHERSEASIACRLVADRQQTYLLTGRLRL